MVTWLRCLVTRELDASPDGLGRFIAARAAFLTQKTVLDYCEVKAGRNQREHFADPDFAAALRHCRWQVFSGAVPDVLGMAESWLRPHATGRETALAAALARIGATIIDQAPAPEEERADLDAARDALPDHLRRLQAAAPCPADRLPLLSEAPLLATLPIHPSQRVGETQAIKGALRFHLVSSQQEMERAFDPAPLAAALVAGA
ncbi:hypothetical protein [Falsiroseomonas sp. HW251]|uniref:hypothetical protein n=1 Tax=Falsiroseomonas sp. HW251 TaxID=3390998 RepID=UPI003D312734